MSFLAISLLLANIPGDMLVDAVHRRIDDGDEQSMAAHVGPDSKNGSGASTKPNASKMARAFHRAQGLILYLMLRPGMTTAQTDQIERVFGRIHATSFQCFANTLTPSVFWIDDKVHGLRVGYMDNNDGVFRLTSIKLIPIEKGK